MSWKTADEIKEIIATKCNRTPTIHEDSFSIQFTFEENIPGTLIRTICKEIPNPCDVHIHTPYLVIPQIEIGFRLEEVV